MYKVNLTDIHNLILNLENNVNILNSKNCSLCINNIKPNIDQTNILYKNIINAFENINPKRLKRGLLNIVGSAQKWLFGTLDNDDLELINDKFNKLRNNQQRIVNEVNLRTSILSHMMNKTEQTIKTINSDLEKIETSLTNIHDRFLITVLNEYILTNAQILLNYLENLENAISFAQLNVVHHSILKNADLEIILEKLNLLYNQKQLAKFGYLQSHRDFYGVQLIRNTNELIFNIKIPILSQETYNLYRLYPIPIQNLTLFLKNPYY